MAIKTHMKNEVLQCLLTSISQHGYDVGNEIVIADDNPCEALPVFRVNPKVSAYLAGSRHGIAYNSNRLINYFLHNSNAEVLVLLDNDICFTRPGMLEDMEIAAGANSLKHIASYIIDADGNDGLQQAFPAVAKTADGSIKWCRGSHGVMQWYTRDIIEKIGYFVRMPYFYGGEHSEHSNRALYVQDVDPTLYPVFARSTRFIQSCPVNFHAYDVDISRTYEENHAVMHARLAKTVQGLDIKEFNSHLDLEREVYVRQGDDTSPEELKQVIKHGRRKKK